MADTDVLAWLYPAVDTQGGEEASLAITRNKHKDCYVPPRRQRSERASPQHLSLYLQEQREDTEETQVHDVLEYLPCLEISLSRIPKGSRGLEVGWDPCADIWIPKIPKVSARHFSLTFNDQYSLIVKDLDSRIGTSVRYNNQRSGSRNSEWIVGGHEHLDKERFMITVRPTREIEFRIVVAPFDRTSPVFRAKVDKFRAGSDKLDQIFDGIGIQTPTALPTGIQTPRKDDFVLRKEIGRGGFAVVHHSWNTRSGRQYACKEPLEKLRGLQLEAWEKEAYLLGRVEHVSLYAYYAVLD